MPGPGHPTYVVAEVGTNHLCSYENGASLFKAAKRAGCDAVKLQLYQSEKLAARDSPLYWEGEARSQREFFSTLDKLPWGDFTALFSFGRSIGLDVFATPFDEQAVDLLAGLDVPWMKVASADITHVSLLRKIAASQRPIMLSTGASTEAEIGAALGTILSMDPLAHVVLLGCSLTYPCPAESANVRQILALQKFGCPVGWSDHTRYLLTPALAVAMGAVVVERHFGNHELVGADNDWAADESEMALIVTLIREAEILCGTLPPKKYVLESEEPARRMARRSLAAAKDIVAGSMLGSHNVTALRPGTGDFPADRVDHVMGHFTTRDIYEGELLRKGDVK